MMLLFPRNEFRRQTKAGQYNRSLPDTPIFSYGAPDWSVGVSPAFPICVNVGGAFNQSVRPDDILITYNFEKRYDFGFAQVNIAMV